MTSTPFGETFWSWYREAEGMGYDVIAFAVERKKSVGGICFAGKVGIGAFVHDHLYNSTSTNWTAKCVSSFGIRDRVSGVVIVCYILFVICVARLMFVCIFSSRRRFLLRSS